MPVSPQNVDTGWKSHPFSVRSLLPNPCLSTTATQNVDEAVIPNAWISARAEFLCSITGAAPAT